jgi:hypothetical protein
MPVYKKADLLTEIESSWSELNAALDSLTEAQMTDPKDAEGWAVKDHLTHMAAWERSMVFLLKGKPRHEGLGVVEDLYLNGTEDEINAAIQRQTKNLSPAQALAELRGVHSQLLGLLERLSDDDLQKPYKYYLPDEPGKDDGLPILDRVHGNSAHHFKEHLGWIQSLIDAKH